MKLYVVYDPYKKGNWFWSKIIGDFFNSKSEARKAAHEMRTNDFEDEYEVREIEVTLGRKA